MTQKNFHMLNLKGSILAKCEMYKEDRECFVKTLEILKKEEEANNE